MTAAPAGRLQRGAQSLLPLATAGVALLADLLPIAAISPQSVAPFCSLITAFYWSLHRPDLISSLDLFALGLLGDLAAATPVGSTSLCLLLARRLVLTPQRPLLAHSFLRAWSGFAATALVVSLARWLLVLVASGSLAPVFPVLIEAALTAAIYPPAAMLLALASLALEVPDDAPAG